LLVSPILQVFNDKKMLALVLNEEDLVVDDIKVNFRDNATNKESQSFISFPKEMYKTGKITKVTGREFDKIAQANYDKYFSRLWSVDTYQKFTGYKVKGP